jgi:hypothetical protein
MTILSRADGSHAASGVVQYIIGARRVRRVDLLVSTDMALTNGSGAANGDTASRLPSPHGSAVVHGVVNDERGRTLADVVLAVASIDTVVRTNADGEFTLAGLPAGTHDMEFRHVGFGPARTSVDLRGASTTNVGIVMTSTQTLAKIDVRADKVSHVDRQDFEKRQHEGFGKSFTEKDFKNPALGFVPILSAVPGVNVRRVPGGVSITMSRLSLGRGITECTPLFWLDGRPDADGAATLSRPLDEFRAIEVFPRATSAPAQYVGLNQFCGVVLIWSKFARW